jgi:hypothetical protein
VVIVNPVPQTEKDHFADNGVVAIDGVAAARVIAIPATAVAEHIVDTILKPLETQGGSEFVPFGGVIENYIQNHFDPGLVQRADHFLKLIDLATGFGADSIAAVGREETKRIVPPIVGPLERVTEWTFGGKFVDRH